MSAQKSRLGRGLNSLISGGIKSSATPSKKPAAKTPQKKTAKKTTKLPAKKATKATSPEVVPTPNASEETHKQLEIPIHLIIPNPHQPRRDFDEEALKELAESIRSEGLLQPIVVRQFEDKYELIAGERRLRACKSLSLKRIPARIIETTDKSSAVLSLIENLQRENLNPIEEALGYACLMQDFKLTQEAVSERIGKSRAAIANSLRLLQLDREIQSFIAKGHLSVGHAKVLLGLDQADDRLLLTRQVIERQLSVRETERLVQARRKGAVASITGNRTIPASELAALADLEKQLASKLATKVQLKHTPKKGKLIIEYYGNDDLQRVLDMIGLS